VSIADDIYAQRQASRRAEREKRAEIEKRLHDEFLAGTPRAARARQFASQVLHLMRKYVPDACMREAEHELTIEAFAQDVEIAPVPPERDIAHAAALKAAEFAMMQPTIIQKT